LPLSVVGGPTDGADDTVELGTNGSLSQCYFPTYETFTTSPVPSQQQSFRGCAFGGSPVGGKHILGWDGLRGDPNNICLEV
jgi:hypothetical protein